MSHVFISYVSENREEVNKLHQTLTSHGIKVWSDWQDLNPGDPFELVIRNAIRGGDFFIACFSKEYEARGKTYMNKELMLAIEELHQRPTNKVWFIPVKLNECEIPDIDIGLGESLYDLHYADLSMDWENGVQNIIKAIQPESEELTGIEAAVYRQTIPEQLEATKILQDYLKHDAPEHIIQQHLYKNLWLLDPSWNRATETPRMNQRVETEFAGIDANLTLAERNGRFDIKYKKTSGKHVIIELKRSNTTFDDYQLLAQTDHYRVALEKLIQAVGTGESVEVVCIVGKPLKQWTTPVKQEASKKLLAERNTRVVLYTELIEDAYQKHQEFLEQNKKAKSVFNFMQSNDVSVI